MNICPMQYMKSLHAKAAKSTFVNSEKNTYLSLSLYTSLWKIENRIHNIFFIKLLGSETYSIGRYLAGWYFDGDKSILIESGFSSFCMQALHIMKLV